ncbi:MAG: cytochrome P450 [Rhodococcus sp. (in: high G+C Gram-positive bacteria)]
MVAPSLPSGFDFTDPDIYAHGLPEAEFAELRKVAPIWWNPQKSGVGGFADEGYWVVTKHRDIKEISLRDDVFSSWENTAIPRFSDDIDRQNIEVQRFVMLNQDAPQHTKTRKLVSKGFTPRAINALESELARRAVSIVTEAKNGGTGEFVTEVASELPLQAIADLIGVPQEDRAKLFAWSNQMMSYDDPTSEVDPLQASTELLGYAYAMADERRKCPVGDIVSLLVSAEIDGESLLPEEFGFFVLVLAVAGNETTRNAITHGMNAFFDNPEQWELYKRDRPESAADEIVRWASPITAFQRTLLSDYEIGGVQMKKGQRAVMFYRSGNFDEDVFENPFTFDIMRSPNPHLGFGGHGAHYCIGANLARMEINLIFNAIADHMPNISRVSDPVRLRSGWLNAATELHVKYT